MCARPPARRVTPMCARLQAPRGVLKARGCKHRATPQDRHQMPAILRVTIDVGRRFTAIGDVDERLSDSIGLHRYAGERLLSLSCPDWCWPHVRQGNPSLGENVTLSPNRRRDARNRPLLSDPDELLIRRAPAGVLRHPNLDKDLVSSDGSGEKILEEVRRRYSAFPTRTGDHELCVQRQC